MFVLKLSSIQIFFLLIVEYCLICTGFYSSLLYVNTHYIVINGSKLFDRHKDKRIRIVVKPKSKINNESIRNVINQM